MKRTVPLIVTFPDRLLPGRVVFVPTSRSESWRQRLLIWFSIVSGFAMLLGVDSLIRGTSARCAGESPDRGTASRS